MLLKERTLPRAPVVRQMLPPNKTHVDHKRAIPDPNSPPYNGDMNLYIS